MSEDEDNFGSGEYAEEDIDLTQSLEEDWEDEFENEVSEDEPEVELESE